MAKARSAKGESVDFDLLRIKEQIANTPKPVDVKTREDYVDRKFQRRMKRKTELVSVTVPTVDVEPSITDNSSIDFDQD